MVATDRSIALQAQDIADEVIGLIGRDDEIGHAAMAGLEGHFQRKRRRRRSIGYCRKVRRAVFAPGGSCVDRMTILAPGLSQTVSGRDTFGRQCDASGIVQAHEQQCCECEDRHEQDPYPSRPCHFHLLLARAMRLPYWLAGLPSPSMVGALAQNSS